MQPRTLQCNLCWEELTVPFLVTSCNHAFCEKHKNEKHFASSTCPGCNAHLSKQGGARLACYNIQNETHLNSLNGLTPSNAVKVVATAIEFWVNQEQNKIAFHKHLATKYKKQVDTQEERFGEAYGQLKQELQLEREQKAESIHAQQELDQEVALLKSKFQEESRKVHSLQEKIVVMKRQRDSPQHSPSAKRQETGYTSERMSSPFADRGGGVGGAPHADHGMGSPRRSSSAGPAPLFPQKQPEREEPSFTGHTFNRHRSPFLGAGGGSRTSTPDRREPSFGSNTPSRFAGFNLGGGGGGGSLPSGQLHVPSRTPSRGFLSR